MKVKFNWDKANKQVVRRSKKRLEKAAEFLAERVREKTPVGSVSWPIYRTGPYKGQPWTARDAGMLKRSVRTTEKYGQEQVLSANLLAGSAYIPGFSGIRVYVGHYLAWYARIVEFYTPFFRPTIEANHSEIKAILENG